MPSVLRVMQKYNLLSVIRRRRFYKYGEYLHKYDNLWKQNFQADRPNQKWATDISYIHEKQGVLYLSIIRDLHDNNDRIQTKIKLTPLEKRSQFVA